MEIWPTLSDAVAAFMKQVCIGGISGLAEV